MLAGRSVGRLVGRSVGRSVGWSVRWLGSAVVGEMNNFRTGTQLRARTSRVPSSQSTGHARIRVHTWQAVTDIPLAPRPLHNLRIIYISLRAIISGPGRAHRVSDKFRLRAVLPSFSVDSLFPSRDTYVSLARREAPRSFEDWSLDRCNWYIREHSRTIRLLSKTFHFEFKQIYTRCQRFAKKIRRQR